MADASIINTDDPRVLMAEIAIAGAFAIIKSTHDYLAQNSKDDDELASIQSQVKARLAARGITQ